MDEGCSARFGQILDGVKMYDCILGLGVDCKSCNSAHTRLWNCFKAVEFLSTMSPPALTTSGVEIM